MYAQLRQEPFRLDSSVVHLPAAVPAAYSFQAVEVSSAERQLEELRQERKSTTFLYDRDDILYSVQRLSTYLEQMRLEVLGTLRDELERDYSQALPGLLSGSSRWVGLKNNTERTRKAILDKIEGARSELIDSTTRQRSTVYDYLKKPVYNLIGLYADENIKVTMFNRQKSLLNEIQSWIPERCTRADRDIKDAIERAKDYTVAQVHQLEQLIEKQTRELSVLTVDYLENNVFVPTRECLDVLFAAHDAPTFPREFATSVDLMSLGCIDAVKEDIANEVVVCGEKALAELVAIKENWLA
jgi:hypothetical protein